MVALFNEIATQHCTYEIAGDPGGLIRISWSDALPAGINPGDLNFLDPKNPLFRISHVMSSAGQAVDQKRPCIITERDRTQTMLICDSGGYQIASGNLKIRDDSDRLKILRWLERHADWAMTLDVPTGPVDSPGYAYSSFRHCLDTTLDHLKFFQANRQPGATKFLNVLQGNTTQQTDIWYDAVKHFEFEGWAFAGVLRHNFFNLCRRIIKMAHENKIQDKNWIHVLGTNELETAVGLSALQRAINLHINKKLRISFDTSSPFRIMRWEQVYQMIRFDRKTMTLPTVRLPNDKRFVGSKIRFPWPSPIGDHLTMGDVYVRPGVNQKTYRDLQGDHYIVNHNLSALCYAVATANRIFDSEQLIKCHSISEDMGEAVNAIEQVIKSGSLQELENMRSVFNRVRRVEQISDADQDRFGI
jgi:hypothetical protein